MTWFKKEVMPEDLLIILKFWAARRPTEGVATEDATGYKLGLLDGATTFSQALLETYGKESE